MQFVNTKLEICYKPTDKKLKKMTKENARCLLVFTNNDHNFIPFD